MKQKKYKAVVFDMDGVIFDSEACVIESWKVVAEKYKIENIEEVLFRCLGITYMEAKKIFLDHYGADFPYDQYRDERSAIYHERYDDGRLPLKAGIRELLQYLKENGYKIGLASSTREAVVSQQLQDARLRPYFDNLTCGDMLKRSKPEPDIYLMACEKLGVCPKETIAIEDSYNGIRSAYRAGMFPVMVPDLIRPDAEMKKLAGAIFENLLDVKVWLEENCIIQQTEKIWYNK